MDAHTTPTLSRRAFLRGAGMAAAAAGLAQLEAPFAFGSTNVRTISGYVRLRDLRVPAGTVLRFDPERTTTLETPTNVIVEGALEMQPANPSVVHTLRFVDVDESRFVGGGMDPVPTDVGLWVIGSGQLRLQGAPKTSWTRYPVYASGWRAGDVVAVAPHRLGDHTGFRLYRYPYSPRFLASVHEWRPEAMNLTRNVRIEGTPRGRAHVHISAAVPQYISNARFRYLGPRKRAADGFTYGVLGRYPLHFHMAGSGTAGSLVEGCVVRDSGNHAFWPHSSDGITFHDCVAYNVFDDAYGWDLPDPTNNTVWDHCVAALVRCDPWFRGYRLTGFRLGVGRGNLCTDCTAVGVRGNTNASGFEWPEFSIHLYGVWNFARNRAHNNAVDGMFAWQNTDNVYEVSDFVAYHNGKAGIEHGAYVNPYVYRNCTLYGNEYAGVLLWAASNRTGIHFDGVRVLGAGATRHGFVAEKPVLYGGPATVANSVVEAVTGRAFALTYRGSVSDRFRLVDTQVRR